MCITPCKFQLSVGCEAGTYISYYQAKAWEQENILISIGWADDRMPIINKFTAQNKAHPNIATLRDKHQLA
jgi:nicotinamide mononucleotide adenylyltransferase